MSACCCAASGAADARKTRAVVATALVAGSPASFEAWLRDELADCATPAASRGPDLGRQLDAIAHELLPRARSGR